MIIVASVSCIYGLGSPTDYKRMMVRLAKGEVIERDQLLLKLVDIQYQRNDVVFERGKFRVRGDTIEVWPAYEEYGLRIELFGDEVDALAIINPLTGEVTAPLDELYVYPAKHFVTPEDADQGRDRRDRAGTGRAAGAVQDRGQAAGSPAADGPHPVRPRHAPRGRVLLGHRELRPVVLRPGAGRAAVHAARLLPRRLPVRRGRVARHACRRSAACSPATAAARRRSSSTGSACPAPWTTGRSSSRSGRSGSSRRCACRRRRRPYELERCGGEVVEQVIRPTGLVDPVIHVSPARGQVPDLVKEIRMRAETKERVLVTTLTKRLAEDLSNYFRESGIRGKWLHSELDAIERVQTLRELRRGRVRRARRRQPAPRRAGPAGSVAGGDPGRGQGGVPAERARR